MTVLFEEVLGVTRESADEHRLIAHINRSQHWMRLTNGSEIWWRGARDSGGRKAGGALSRQFGFICFDEIVELSEESFLFWIGRLRHPVGPNRWAAATNPDPNWCKQRFHPDSKDRMTGVHFFQTSTREKYYLHPDYERRLRENYPEGWVKRFLDGSWDVFEGQIFTEFDRRVHVWSFDVPEPGIWREFSVLDLGFTNPTAWYLYGLDYDDRMYVWGEHYRSGWRPAQHAEVILPVVRARGIRLNLADPSAWGKESTGNTPASEYGQAGLHLTKANNDVMGSILAIKRMLKEGVERGAPGLNIHPSCVEMIREIPGFRWKKLTPTMQNMKNNPEDPVKKDDHSVDNLRYAANYARSGGKKRPKERSVEDLARENREKLVRESMGQNTKGDW